uniref:Calmodulin III n=1 Tax=Euglena gracilis TaxID=3039 RepID=C0L9G7_EUGGR|nr:calmodulin III [Euglena gracilis]
MADTYELHIHFTAEQLASFKEAFNEVDKDGDGIVASRELSSLTRTLGIPCTDTEIERMIKSLDDDGSNTMDFPEFLELMNQKMFPTLLGQTDMAKLFQQVDVDHKKCITRADLRHLLATLGRDAVTDEELDELEGGLDMDHDGVIDLTDFNNCLGKGLGTLRSLQNSASFPHFFPPLHVGCPMLSSMPAMHVDGSTE